MTAPLPSTSFGSQQRNCGERELQVFNSPLKRTHSQGQKGSGGDEAANQQSGQDGAVIRPVKKLKQVAVIDEEESEGLVARLFKYAWHFVGGAPEERNQASSAAIQSDKLQILRKMLDKQEIVVPEHNPTIDLTAESDREDDVQDENATPQGKKPSRKDNRKGKGASTFRPHGSIFQSEINLPDDDHSTRHRSRQWHSPKPQTAIRTSKQQASMSRGQLGMSMSRTPIRNGSGPISPTPGSRIGQSVSSLTSSMAKLNTARNGSVVSSVTSVGDEHGRQRWGLSARQQASLDRIVPKFEGRKDEELPSPVSLIDGTEAYRQLLNTFRAAEGVKERSSLSLSTLELAKAWSQAGLGHSTSDLKKSVNAISSVKTKPSKQEKWLYRQREIGQKAYEEAKAREEIAKEIGKELEKLAIQDKQLRDEALAKARARALTKIEVPVLTPEQVKEVSQQLANPSFKSKCDLEEVSTRDLQTLGPKNWLNDEVINFYGAMLMDRAKKEGKRKVHFFNSFFFSKMAKDGYEKSRIGRWTKKIDIFAKDIIIFPINQNNVHWVCGAINIKDKRFEFYDSMSTVPNTKAFAVMREYLQKEHMDKKKKPIDLSEWEDYSDPRGPQQLNAHDCGVFTCQTLEHRARGVGDKGDDMNESAAWEFEQKHMDEIRKLMQWELIHAKLAKRGRDED
ncbi:hypothetical protein QFC19_005125 [Naganishia cerealis]|uniref:Uncharacterized protein n=1 Tax=Naganishia cerealis TaxID=610337 RepID=A0ACC2VR32_9TREE|nr:hypothetical protein QFC19_005125 [Naganishia cerealis]